MSAASDASTPSSGKGSLPRTAWSAVLREILGELDDVLTRTDQTVVNLDAASARLDQSGQTYASQIRALTDETKVALVEFIQRRTAAASAEALSTHRAAMRDAATLAFAEQLAPAVRDIARQVEQHKKDSLINATKGARQYKALAVLSAFAAGAICASLLIGMHGKL